MMMTTTMHKQTPAPRSPSSSTDPRWTRDDDDHRQQTPGKKMMTTAGKKKFVKTARILVVFNGGEILSFCMILYDFPS
jgi:hypothetical protein